MTGSVSKATCGVFRQYFTERSVAHQAGFRWAALHRSEPDVWSYSSSVPQRPLFCRAPETEPRIGRVPEENDLHPWTKVAAKA